MSDADTELAWAAGFFDGEGSIFVNHQVVPRKRRAEGERPPGPPYQVNTPVLSVSQVEFQPLERFARAVSGRTPTGPYKPRSARSRPYYRWDASGRPSTHRVLSLLWPYMSEPKKAQARRVWAELEALTQPKSPPLPALPEEVVVCGAAA